MIRLERDQNLAVGGSDRRRIAEREIYAAQRQTDIVQQKTRLRRRHDPPDARLHGVEDLIGLFQPRSGGGSDMETKLPGVHEREKILSGKRQQKRGAGKDDTEFQEHEPAVLQRPLERRAILFPELFETPVKRPVNAPE